MFYVYTYLREDGTPYYVGKGKGQRAFYKGKHERIKKPRDNSRIVIVEDNLSEKDAHNLETELIERYGRKDIGTGILQNRTNGGEGISGAKFGRPPEERIEKIAASNRGRKHTEKARENMSRGHIGKKDSEETKKKKSASARKPKSEVHRKNIAEAKKGEKNPMYGKVSPMKGKTLSEETKQKIREARAKQVISPETRLKMAEAQRKRHAARKKNNF